MTGLHQHVRQMMQRHGLCPAGTRLLVGVSGGSDSVALTRLLLDLSKHGEFAVAALAHFNHRLRPTASRDEQFCRELASVLSLPITVGTLDVRDYAATERLSIEAAARRARYAFLHRTAADVGADRIAVGHTQDDQAETFLLKLARGAGLTGLGSIYPRRGVVIRPLLAVSRADLREYLADGGHAWVDDESNDDLDNPRNRIRHRVLPELDAAYRGARAGLARTAAAAGDDGTWLDALAAQRFEALAHVRNGAIEFDRTLLIGEPLPVRRRVLLQAMRRLAENKEIGLDHVEKALEVLEGRCPGTDAPGSRLELQREKLVLVIRR